MPSRTDPNNRAPRTGPATPIDPTNLAQLKPLLAYHGVRLTKRMGQHLLVDRDVLRRIVVAAAVADADEVLEAGPGAGGLTLELAARAKRVVAVELDPRMVAALREVLGLCAATLTPGFPAAPSPRVLERRRGRTDGAGGRTGATVARQQGGVVHRVEILQADALQVDPTTLFDRRPYKLVANLPYSIATPLIRRLLYHPHPPAQLTVMVQKEVAGRLAAQPGESRMGVLTVQVQLVADVEPLFDVPPPAFLPPPQVDSAVVQLVPRAAPRVMLGEVPRQRFFRTVEAGFGQRRKQLHNALGSLGLGSERIGAALVAAGVAADRRAQTLSLEEWAALARALWA